MALGNLSQTCTRGSNRPRAGRAETLTHAVCETLEARRLLATFTYVVPAGHTAAYIEARPNFDGQVQVRLDLPTNPVVHFFTNVTGLDIIDSGTNNPSGGFLFVDKVSAEDKPTVDTSAPNDPFGIKVQGGSGGHLRIEAAANDHSIKITESTANSATVEARDGGILNYSRFGSGVDKLTIQTHTSGDTIVEVATVQPGPGFAELPGLHPNTALRIDALGPFDTILLGGSENASVDATIRIGAGDNTIILEQTRAQGQNHADGTTTARIDFDPSLGGGLDERNKVWVGADGNGRGCTAILDWVPGASSHTMLLDSIIISNGIAVGGPDAALIVKDPATVGELIVGPDTIATIEAPITIVPSISTTGSFLLSGTASFTGSSDPSIIHHVERALFEFPTGVMNLLSGSDVTVRTTSELAALNIGVEAKFTLQERVGTPLPPSNVLTVAMLHIDKTPSAPDGMLDLKNNSMIIDYDGDSPLADIQALITNAYNGDPRWTGFGINSSIAADVAANNNLPHKTGIGYGEATDIFSTINQDTRWDGQPVNSTMVLVKYTWYGDATLDGMVNLADFNRTAANFGQSPRRWTQGNFNYDTVVNLADFNLLAGNFGQSGGLGGGDPRDCEELTLEELQDLWEEARS